MSILEGAYWISFREPRKSLKADADGSVWGVDPGPRGIDVLDAAALRSRIWLAEKATDGQNFRFRNYETGSSLDSGDQGDDGVSRVVATRGCTEGQLWDVVPLKGIPAGPMYQMRNIATSTILGQSKAAESRCRIVLDTPDSQQGKGWLIEPVLLPTLYSFTNASQKLMLCAPNHPNPSDGVSGAVKLVSPEQATRKHLWTIEYVSLNEAIIRSASYNLFALDLASDSHSVLARKCHGGPSQCWTVKNESEEVSSFANMKAGTLLAIQQRKVIKDRSLNRLVAVPNGATRWQIQSYPQPPLFWVTIQGQIGGNIAQVDDGSLVLYEGPLGINDHTAQWRFVMVGDGLEYVIENRATGFMFGANATADRNDINFHWMVSSAESGTVNLVNAGSKKLVFRATDGTLSNQQVGYQTYDSASGNAVPCQSCDWYLKPAYDNLPSFALVNSYTGRCITNNPVTNIGTVSTTNHVNDFRSQWYFHAQSVGGTVDDLACLLSSKISGNSLEVCYQDEIRVEAYNDHRQSLVTYPTSSWRLLPLSTRLLALCMHFGPGFLYDPGDSSPQTEGTPKNIQSLYWYLVSHRESGFDFMSLAFSATEQVVSHLSSEPSETPWDAIQRYLCTEREATNKPGSAAKCIPFADKVPHAMDATIRAALAFLIAQWVESFIPKTSTPHTIIAVPREDVEKQWGICLSERALRRSSEQQAWIRIDLQGVYDIGGTWVADIQGQWLDTQMFQVILPTEEQVDYVVVQRAMLQSLNQGLAVQVKATPPSLVAEPSENARPDVIRQHDSKHFTKGPIPPTPPNQPRYNNTSYEYTEYQRSYAQYLQSNERYRLDLEAYNNHPYQKIPSADMRFINQLLV